MGAISGGLRPGTIQPPLRLNPMKFDADSLSKTKVGRLPENQKRIAEAQRSIGRNAAAAPVGGVEDPQPKPHKVPALDPRAQTHPGSERGLVVVVTIIRCSRTEIDSDNLVAGAKPIRDACAKSLGVDDRDRRIKWEYRQCIGEGPEGTLVKINTFL